MPHSLQLLLLLALIVAAAKGAGALAVRAGMPTVLGELVAGLLLGPTLLDVMAWPVFSSGQAGGASPVPLIADIRDFAAIGVMLLMFVAGLETDLAQVRKVGRVAFWSALGGVVLPLGGGIALAAAFGYPIYWEAIFIGTILTATSVSISAQTLIELRALRSPEGSTIISAAVIDDVMGIVVLSLVVALARGAGGGSDLTEVAVMLARAVAFFVVGVVAGRMLGTVLGWGERLGVSQGVLATALVIALLYAWAAEYLGAVAAITGAYLAGVLVARTRFRHEVEAGVQPLAYSMFVPVFFVSIGLEANGRDLGAAAAFTVALIVVAVLTKAVGAGVAARLCGFNRAQATRVGVGMISRGEVGLIVASYALANRLVGPEVFSAVVVMVLATTMATPVLLRLVFPVRARGAHH